MSNKPETARQPAKPTDLLPCPFCGKPPTTERITSTAGDSWVWSIQCDGCDVYCSTAAWNTRAGDPAQQVPAPELANSLIEAVDGFGDPLKATFPGWPKKEGYRLLANHLLKHFDIRRRAP